MQEPLADGGVIRKLWIGEAGRYRDHLLRLDRESRHSRFGGGGVGRVHRRLRRTPRSGWARWCTASSSTACCGARPNCARSGRAFAREAEAALSIEADWQSHGVGSALLDRTLLAARNRGIKTLHMACLANNRRMQELARKFAAELSFDFGGVVGEVAAARPTPLSVLRELVADNCGFATAVLDVQSRLLQTRRCRRQPALTSWRGLAPILVPVSGIEGNSSHGCRGSRSRRRNSRPGAERHRGLPRASDAARPDEPVPRRRPRRRCPLPRSGGVGRDPDRRLCQRRDAGRRRDRAGPHGAARRSRHHRRERLSGPRLRARADRADHRRGAPLPSQRCARAGAEHAAATAPLLQDPRVLASCIEAYAANG